MRIQIPPEEDQLITSKPLPFKSHFHYVGGHRLHYLDEGSGPVVIMLHGNPTWCYYYRNLVERLSGTHRVIVPDYLGCGLSSHPPGAAYRAMDRVEQIESLISSLRLEKFSLVMHDWGGAIGTALALKNIDHIERLVYLNTTISETESLPKVIRLAAKPFIGKYLTKYSKRFLKLTTDWGVCKKLPKEVREAYFYPYRNARRREAIWQFVSDIPFDSTHPSYALMLEIGTRLPELSKVPVQIVWGLKDPCFHRGMLTKLMRHFPHARILEIPQASHLVLEDAPQEACNAISDFLSTDRNELLREGLSGANTRLPVMGSEINALYAAFCGVAERMPRANAAVSPLFLGDTVRYTQMSYADLYEQVAKYQRGLHQLGLRSGDRVIMLVPAGIEFLALTLAVMARGAVPVFIDPGMGRENLYACIEEVSPQVLIGSVKAQALRLLNKKVFAGLRFHIVASEWVPFGGPNLSFLKKFSAKPMDPGSSNGISMIAFTSGATGRPKGVLYTDRMIEAQLRIFRDQFQLEAGKKDLPLLGIFSIFNVANGICSVFPPINASKPLAVEPARVEKLIQDLDIHYSFGSPTLWNKIAEYCIRTRSTLPSLEKIFMAGAPVSAEILEKVTKAAPSAALATPYGATEALPVTLCKAEDVLDHDPARAESGEFGVFVGSPIDGVQIRIIEISNEPVRDISQAKILPPFQIGEILVKGDNVSPSYWDRPDADELSKVRDGSGFWHRMGDVGYTDEAGRFYFCGRKAHIVRCKGRVFYSVPIESIFNSHPKVRRSALVSLSAGKDVGIVIEPKPEAWPESYDRREAFKQEMLQLARSSELASPIERVYFNQSFPVDARHNAKIFRDKLGAWATAEDSELDSAA
ncbi:MAG: alpha/beta fold hydrolase [Deltaproteobacteria bacterium]|nr:alpha/beta fold hydrolase [Deltaproteobacteria bacterium]